MSDTNYQKEWQSGIIDPLNKGIGTLEAPLAPDAANALPWNLLMIHHYGSAFVNTPPDPGNSWYAMVFGRPLKAYFFEVLMEQNLIDTIALLSRTPAALDVLLRDLPKAWTSADEGENTWTAFDVMGHLIHGERTDWMPRLRMILEFGDTQTFVPFDRFAQFRESEGKSLPQLLDQFARLRAENLAELRALNLQPADFERRGRHPALGGVTLSQLLAAWTVHDLTHLHQISRIMAHQYRDAVGPWSTFLGVLQCAGHSA